MIEAQTKASIMTPSTKLQGHTMETIPTQDHYVQASEMVLHPNAGLQLTAQIAHLIAQVEALAAKAASTN